MQLTEKLGYCCDTEHLKKITRIMTGNILPGHVRILGHIISRLSVLVTFTIQYNLKRFITYLTILSM